VTGTKQTRLLSVEGRRLIYTTPETADPMDGKLCTYRVRVRAGLSSKSVRPNHASTGPAVRAFYLADRTRCGGPVNLVSLGLTNG